MSDIDSVIEHCARALWEAEIGSKWRESYPFDSDDPVAEGARKRAMERARIVLDAAESIRARPAFLERAFDDDRT